MRLKIRSVAFESLIRLGGMIKAENMGDGVKFRFILPL